MPKRTSRRRRLSYLSDTHPPPFVLDSGAVLAQIKGDGAVVALVEDALKRKIPCLIPPIVVTETYRGGSQEVTLNRLLKYVVVPPTDISLAQAAGERLAVAPDQKAPDAQVAALAIAVSPCTVLTSDPTDIKALLDDLRLIQKIVVLDVGKPDTWVEEIRDVLKR